MQKILNYLFIVLIFTVLQVTNVGAQDKMAPDTAIAVEQMEFHYDCGSSKYDEEARNACFTHERLKELQAKITDLEGQLLGAATAAKSMGDALNANHVEITALKAKNNDLAARIIEKENWIITRSGINDDELRTLKEEVSRVNQALEDAMNDGIQCMKKRDVKIATLERKLLDFKCGQVVKPE
jgi:hypothetical protein